VCCPLFPPPAADRKKEIKRSLGMKIAGKETWAKVRWNRK
jgi:hypothetical protein